MEIVRERYISSLHAGKDATDTVKILTGMRRVGKSTILRQYMRRLVAEGVDEKMMFYLNMDILNDEIDNKHLESMMSPFLKTNGLHYVFLDEIQKVERWELLIAMLVERRDCDVYITGSNSKMFSSELSTNISGRYECTDVFPFSFSEYLELRPGDVEQRFNDYLTYGALPVIEPERGKEFCEGQLEGILNTVAVKDIMYHMKINDVSDLYSIIRYLYSNIGNTTNVDTIAKEIGLNNVTVKRYISELVSAHLFYHCEKYDIVGKKILKTNGKFFANDLGMRNVSLNGAVLPDISRPIENLVYIELRRRGFNVRVGSYRSSEVDFTAFGDDVEYYQVTETMMGEETRKREFFALERISDNCPKYVLTMDRYGLGSYNGIKVLNLLEWLLDRDQ